MKRFLILLVIACLLFTMPVCAVIETFQDFDYSDVNLYVTYPAESGGGWNGIQLTNPMGCVTYKFLTDHDWDGYMIIPENQNYQTIYFAMDFQNPNPTQTMTIYLYNSAGTVITSFTTTMVNYNRIEMKVIGNKVYWYIGGGLVSTSGVITEYPTYIKVYCAPGFALAMIDNIVYGGTDHYCIGALPENWSIQRDLLNPIATGVYAYNPNTQLWVLKNSYDFYVDADKEYLNAEPLQITHYSTGTVVNTTILTAVKNQVKYSVNDFLSQSTSLGPSLPDGMYSVHFANSTNQEFIWVISNGASISFDQPHYNLGDLGVVSYSISPLYYTADYDYTYKIIDIYGTEKASDIITQEGTFNVLFSDTTYEAGVYYVQIIATKKSDNSVSIMSYGATTVQDYMIFQGLVMDAVTALPISGANVSMVQETLYSNSITPAAGNYTTSGTFLTGGALTANVTKSGYQRYNYTFIPRNTKRIDLNFTLMPVSRSGSGLTLDGVVRDELYGRPIVSVNITAANNTWSESHISLPTNIAGYYRIDESMGSFLAPNRVYEVKGNKERYSSSIYYKKMIPS